MTNIMRMNKALSVLVCLLFVSVVFLPFSVILVRLFGYRFSLFSYSFFAIVTAVLSVASAVLSFFTDNEKPKRKYCVFASLVPILLVVNCGISFVKCSSDEFYATAIAMMISFLFAVILSLQVGKPVVLKAFILTISLVAVIPFVIIVWIMSAFHDLGAGANTVVESILSPDGERWVEVIDNDQGALGGATVITVCEDKGIDVFVFKIEKASETIYVGEWREYEDLNIRWKDNDTVLINSSEYEID